MTGRLQTLLQFSELYRTLHAQHCTARKHLFQSIGPLGRFDRLLGCLSVRSSVCSLSRRFGVLRFEWFFLFFKKIGFPGILGPPVSGILIHGIKPAWENVIYSYIFFQGFNHANLTKLIGSSSHKYVSLFGPK